MGRILRPMSFHHAQPDAPEAGAVGGAPRTRTDAAVADPVVGHDAPHVHAFDNGLTVVFEPKPWLPTLSATLLLPFGSVTDPDGREGSTNVLHEWMQRGAGSLSSRAYSDALEDLGVRRGGAAGRETSSLTMSFLASESSAVLPLLAAMVREPRLDEEEFEPSRELALQELEALDDAPTQRMFEALLARFFTSPQRRSSYGTETGLRVLSADGVRQDFAERVGPQGAILAMAGGGTWETLLGEVEEAFAGWRGAVRPTPPVAVADAARHHVQADSAQLQIGLAFPSPVPGTDEAYLFNVGLNVLSGSMGSRLFTEVREKRGLVYSVNASYRALKGFGYTLGYAGTTPERAKETLEVYVGELRRLKDGVDEAEIQRARTGILSTLVMQGDSTGATASRLASDMFHIGRPRTLDEVKARVEGVTLEALNAYLAANPLPEPTVLTLGPKAITGEGGAA
jgi:predicted Zn-dependent peptidase